MKVTKTFAETYAEAVCRAIRATNEARERRQRAAANIRNEWVTYLDDEFEEATGRFIEQNGNLTLIETEAGEPLYLSPAEVLNGYFDDEEEVLIEDED